MYKILTAALITAVALAVFFLGQVALIVVGGIATGLVLGEVVDLLGMDILATRKGSSGSTGQTRSKGRERDDA
ncbi:MAG: hypothetical protein WCK63_18475 [Betaproteobacteria bacterium]|jgi:hypothetical protein